MSIEDQIKLNNNTNNNNCNNKNKKQIPQRVAVVGTGLAGLLTAYTLAKSKKTLIQVDLYEAGKQWGLNAESVDLDCWCQECLQESSDQVNNTSKNSGNTVNNNENKKKKHGKISVDVPMRAFHPGKLLYL